MWRPTARTAEPARPLRRGAACSAPPIGSARAAPWWSAPATTAASSSATAAAPRPGRSPSRASRAPSSRATRRARPTASRSRARPTSIVEGFVVDGRTRAGIRAVLGAHVTCARNRRRLQRALGHPHRLRRRPHSSRTTRPTARVLEHGIYVSNSGDRPVIRGNHLHDNHANGIHMNGDAEPGRRRHHLGRARRGQRDLRQRRRRRLRHQLRRRVGRGHPQQPALRQPRERHLALPDRRGGRRRTTWSSTTPIVSAADGRWCLNIQRRHTGNTVAQQHPLQPPLLPRRDRRSTPTASPASPATTTW